jgi:hypothetical protein
LHRRPSTHCPAIGADERNPTEGLAGSATGRAMPMATTEATAASGACALAEGVWNRLQQRHKRRTVIAVAAARELAGFCWAVATADWPAADSTRWSSGAAAPALRARASVTQLWAADHTGR